ncbi:glycine--tRNA ligase subunit beta [Hyphomonas sp.]|uniref:glycine--tRNA ligase subunit beta n=1 Tax=Hyphomonas sp. TaxID=87 RepID=UPI00356498D4
MADLLLEIFCEEIPARMQAKAEADLGKALGDALTGAGLAFDALETASGPRRLSVNVTGLPVKSADVSEQRKGPKVGSPDQAIAGFLKGAGLTSIDQAEVRTDPKKGDFYVAMLDKPGRLTADVVAEAVPAIIRSFHWPKSMRWGTRELRWVRPLQRILCVLDGVVVPFEVDGLASGNQTEGHRVHERGPFTVTGWADYSKQLEGKGHVRLTRDARRDVIAKGIADVCAKAGLTWVEDAGLLEEVTGLAEWPVVILGDMDPAFLELPPEVITLSMRTHQKYFAVNDKKTGKLAPHFIVVANIDASDGGKQIAAGNARVLSARLEDGRFFWDKDKSISLDEMGQKLSTIAFKDELGSLGDKVERVAALARELAPAVGADPDLAERAARLAKADLVSEMVGEFPELQGVMGRYYALAAGEPASVADAIRDHYKPQGPSDAVPTDPLAIAVALADKLDTLVGFWAIDEKPTGSKDPFALRRAALGVVRIVLENEVRLGVASALLKALTKVSVRIIVQKPKDRQKDVLALRDRGVLTPDQAIDVQISIGEDMDAEAKAHVSDIAWQQRSAMINDLLSFFADRLKQVLRDQGQRHDLIDAVFALGEDDLVLITRRVEALGAFLDTEDGATLLAGYKRAANILKAEEKKGALPEDLSVDAALIKKGPKEEQGLYAALTAVRKAIAAPLKDEDFAGAMGELARLRAPVDAFFEGVMVNDEDAKVRANRLALLTEVRATLHQVADFSLIEG